MPSRRPWLISFNNKSRARSNGALTSVERGDRTVRIIRSRREMYLRFKKVESGLSFIFYYLNFPVDDEFCKSMTSNFSNLFSFFFSSHLSLLWTHGRYLFSWTGLVSERAIAEQMETRFGKTGLMTRAMTEVLPFLERRCRFSHFILRAYRFIRKSSAEAFPLPDSFTD